mgnify:CR=1 FL=1
MTKSEQLVVEALNPSEYSRNVKSKCYFWSKTEILAKNPNFDQNSKLRLFKLFKLASTFFKIPISKI